MFSAIAGLLTSGVLGGLTGFLGNIITGFFNYKSQKQKYEHELAKGRLNIEIINAKTDASIKIVKAEVQGKVDLADSNAYETSIKLASQKNFSDKWIDRMLDQEGWIRWVSVPMALFIAFLFGMVDFLKALMRPGLTITLSTATGIIMYLAWSILQKYGVEVLTITQAGTLFLGVVEVILYLTVTCVTWHFGDRRMAKFLMRLNDGNFKNLKEEIPSNNSIIIDEVTPTDEEE